MKSHAKGFTLIELLVSIAIISVITTIGITAYSQAQMLARDAKRKEDLQKIAVSLGLFYQQYQRYPCSGLYAGPYWDFSSTTQTNWLIDQSVCAGGTGNGLEPNFINNMPIDPKTNGNAYSTGGYGYHSAYNPSGTGAQNQCYILITQLENAQDKQALANLPGQTYTGCSGGLVITPGPPAGYGSNSYIVSP